MMLLFMLELYGFRCLNDGAALRYVIRVGIVLPVTAGAKTTSTTTAELILENQQLKERNKILKI